MALRTRAQHVPLRQWLSFRLAFRQLASNLRRLTATIFAVAAGVALVVAVYLMNRAVLTSFLDTVDALAGRAALTIAGSEGSPFPEAVRDSVARQPGVRLAVPLVRGVAFPDDDSGDLLTVMGVDLTNESFVRVYHDAERPEDVVDDLLVFLSQPDSIIVGHEWASHRGLAVGESVDLVTPSGVRTFVVRGLIAPQRLASTLGGRVVVMDIYAAQQAFGERGLINQIDLLLDDDARVADVKAALARTLPPGLVAREPAVQREVVRTTVRGFQSMLLVFALLAAVAGVVICYSRLRSLFEARLWQVGVFRAIGLTRGLVFVELLKESLVLGSVGIVVGVPAGVVIARWAFPAFARGTALNFHLPVARTMPSWDPGAVALGIGVGLVAALLAAVLPAYRLAGIPPVAALRLRGRSLPHLDVRRRLAVTGVVLAAGVALAAIQHLARLPALGIVATAFFTVSGLTLSAPLVFYGSDLLGRAHEALFGTVGRLAASELSHQSTRVTLAISTLGIGLGAVLFFGVLGWSFERSLLAQLGARFRADVVVNSAFVSEGWIAAPIREDVVDEVAAVPGVAGVAAQHLRDVDANGRTVLLFSYDAPCFRNARMCRWPLLPAADPDALERVATGRGVLVSVSVAHEQGLRVGDTIALESPSGTRRMRVVGIAREEPAKAVVMSRDAYREAWNDYTVSWIHVVLADPTTTPAMIAELGRRLGRRHRVQVRRMGDYLDYLAGQVRQAFSGLYVMETITFLLVLFGIADALGAGVLERTRRFGMMRAVGLSRARLCQLVLIEGMNIGILGTALALTIGLVLGVFWVYFEFPALLGWNLTLEVPVPFIVIGAMLSLLLAVGGALGPSVRAARLPVPIALREE